MIAWLFIHWNKKCWGPVCCCTLTQFMKWYMQVNSPWRFKEKLILTFWQNCKQCYRSLMNRRRVTVWASNAHGTFILRCEGALAWALKWADAFPFSTHSSCQLIPPDKMLPGWCPFGSWSVDWWSTTFPEEGLVHRLAAMQGPALSALHSCSGKYPGAICQICECGCLHPQNWWMPPLLLQTAKCHRTTSVTVVSGADLEHF